MSGQGVEAGAGSGSWRILRLLGRGSFGEVFEAEYTGADGFRRIVAIKTLRADTPDDGEHGRRLRDEARMLGFVRHPAVVRVERTVRVGGRWGFVMEHVDGLSLAALQAQVAIPVGAALHVVGEIAGALHACYQSPGPDGAALRLLHRDIKPANVLVTAEGEVKVLDFGIAQACFAGREAETRSMVFGSPGYMAPERFELKDSPAADIYSAGVVLYELLAGRRLGRCAMAADSHGRQIRLALAQLGRTRPELTEPTLALLAELLAFAPEARPSATELRRRCLTLNRGAEPFALWAEREIPPVRDEMTCLFAGPLEGVALVDELVDTPPLVVSPPLAVQSPSLPPAPRPPGPREGRSASGRALAWLLCLLLLGLSPPVRPLTAPLDVSAAEPVASVHLAGSALAAPAVTEPEASPVTRAVRTRPPRPDPSARGSSAPELAPAAPSGVALRLCGPAELWLESSAGAPLFVQVGDDWRPLPGCFPSLPFYRVGREHDGEIRTLAEVSAGASRASLVISCDDRRCHADYNH